MIHILECLIVYACGNAAPFPPDAAVTPNAPVCGKYSVVRCAQWTVT